MNDFGFTAVDETELEPVKVNLNVVNDLNEKCNELYEAMLPLLNNLLQNAEKEYIYWPNRTEKIEAFKNKLLDILER